MKVLPTPEPSTATGPIVDLSDAATRKRVKAKLRLDIPGNDTITAWLDSARTGLNRRDSKKDRTSPLAALIMSLLKRNPHPTTGDVLDFLENRKSEGVIEEITHEEIVWIDKRGRQRFTQITALPNLVSRAKKKLEKYR